MVSGLHGLGIAELTDMLGTGPGEYMPDTMADDPETQYRGYAKMYSGYGGRYNAGTATTS